KLVARDCIDEVVAPYDADESVVLKAEFHIGVYEEDEWLVPRRADVRRLHMFESRLQNMRVPASEAPRVIAPMPAPFRRHPDPVDRVTFDASGIRLQLDEVQARVAEDQEIELVEPSRRRIEKIDERPYVIGVGIRKRLLDEFDAFALVGVR